MKLLTIMILLSTLFFTACSTKKGFFAQDELHQSALSHSQKGEIYNSLELKASIVATYLNCSLMKCDRKGVESFLVAIYIAEDSSDESKQGLMNKSYLLTLNGRKPLSVSALDYHDDMIKIAPFRNRWSKYYLVKFKQKEGEKLVMEYKNTNFGSVILSFVKEY